MTVRRYRAGEVIAFTVNHAPGNARSHSLLDYVASRLAVNRRRAEKLFTRGAVEFNGAIVGANAEAPLLPPASFRIVIPENLIPHLVPSPIPLEVLYEDDFLAAVNKPSGIIAHPARGHLDGNTVQNGVLYRYRGDAAPDKTIAPPHRLDLDTSGVLLFSRTGESYRRLCALMKTYAVQKTYWAIVEGAPEWNEITVDAPIGVNPINHKIGAVIPEPLGGKAASTFFIVKQRGDNWALIEARPRTGRGHQIRLHLQHCGYPLIGDRDYNPHSAIAFPRQALHALSVTFTHPFTEQVLTITAPLPADMSEFIWSAGVSPAKP